MGLIDIYDTNGREINMTALGLTGLRLVIPSPSYNTTTKKVDGQGGQIVVDRVLEERKLKAVFFTQARDYKDSLVIRDKVYSILGSGQYFYMSETKNPLKRWYVYLDEWTPDRLTNKVHAFEIPLVAERGSSESINLVERTFNTSSFSFKNEGSLTIDPRVHSDFEIEFKGTSTNLTITNETSGDMWSYDGSTTSSDVVLLKGVRSLKNGSSIFGKTNKKLITMTPGLNSFRVSGAVGGFDLTIRSRFHFL